MRWRFIDPTNQHEAAERSLVIARIDSWWREFQARADDIVAFFKRKGELDLPEWMREHLDGIDSQLMWEFGPAVRGEGHRLVITPESAHHMRPLVRTILKRAPLIEGWEFYEYRVPEDLEATRMTVQARTGRDITGYTFRASRGEQERVDLNFAAPDGRSTSAAVNAAFVATETLVGEQCLDHWIGLIRVVEGPRPKGLRSLFRREPVPPPPHFVGLDRMADTVNAVIGSMREQLPPTPHHDWVEGAQWTLWKLQPKEADEYFGQEDLFVARSANPGQWTAAHSGGLFASERFSRVGETFCYLKLDGVEGFPEDGFADKAAVEDALDGVLKPAKLGCCIGGGTGLRYSYIDLALTDVDEAIPAVRQRLQAGGVSKRSWIRFYDSDLATEWVGIYDDTPPPPMAPPD